MFVPPRCNGARALTTLYGHRLGPPSPDTATIWYDTYTYRYYFKIVGWGMYKTPKIETRPFLSVFTLLERFREVQLDGCY